MQIVCQISSGLRTAKTEETGHTSITFHSPACLVHSAVAVARLAAFRDAMQNRSPAWKNSMQLWTCPTPPANSDSSCDPCGRLSDGNWYHMHCRGNSRGEFLTCWCVLIVWPSTESTMCVHRLGGDCTTACSDSVRALGMARLGCCMQRSMSVGHSQFSQKAVQQVH